MLQGLTIVANDGVMVKPYVVSKIVNSSGKTVLENKREEIDTVVSNATVKKIKELLRSVISDDITTGTGYAYKMEGYDLIGKTGTASIFEKGKYLTGDGNYIYSFSGLYPGDNPEIIIYMAIKKPKDGSNYIAPAVKEVLVNTSKYLSIEEKVNENKNILLNDYSNKIVTDVEKELKNAGIKVITLGTGKKIINQYPNDGIIVYENGLVVLLTNDYDKTMIDFSGLSYKEVKEVLNLMNVEYELEGYGYAYSQNIEKGSKIDKKVTVKFKGLY